MTRSRNQKARMADADLVPLHDAEGRELGLVPLLQARTLALAHGFEPVVGADGVRFGSETRGSLPWRVLAGYPSPVASCYRALLAESHPFTRLHRLIDCYEATITLVALTGLQVVVATGDEARLSLGSVLDRLQRPLTSTWLEVLRACGRVDVPDSDVLQSLRALDLTRHAQPLLVARNRLAHTAVPTPDACLAEFMAALPHLHGLFDQLRWLGSLTLVEVGEEGQRDLVGSTPSAWGPIRTELPSGHVGFVRGEWVLDLHPLVVSEPGRVPIMPIFVFAGLRRREAEFLAHHIGERIQVVGLRQVISERFLNGIESEAAAPAGVRMLLERYGKYRLLDLVARGVVDLEGLVRALDGDPSSAEDVLRGLRGEHATLETQGLIDSSRFSVTSPGLLLAGEAPTLTRLRAPAPLPSEPLFGRDPELAQVRRSLGHGVLVTLHGLGGIGKSTVARAVAASHPRAYVVDLAAGGALVERIGEVIGWAPDQPLVLEAPILVVLDNLDTVVSDPLSLQALREFVLTPQVLLLATCRRTVRESFEEPIRIGPLGESASRTLVQRAAGSCGNPLTDEQVEQRLVVANGHPLSLELLARRVGVGVPAATAQVIIESWDRTSPRVRTLVSAAVLDPGGVGRWLLEALRLEPADVQASAQGLLDPADGRWRCHELVREVLHGRVQVEELAACWTDALSAIDRPGGENLAWFRQAAPGFFSLLPLLDSEQAARLLVAASTLVVWTGMGAEGLEAGQALLNSGQTELRVKLALMAYFVGRHQEAVGLAADALALDEHDHQARYLLSAASRARGDLERATVEMERAYEDCLRAGDERHRPNFLKELGVLAHQAGDLDRAAERLRESITAYSDDAEVARSFARQCLGRVEADRGDPVEAERLARDALDTGRRLGEPRVRGYALSDLARLHLDRGSWTPALQLLDGAEGAFVAAGHPSAVGRTALDRARALDGLGMRAAAWRELDRAQRVLARHGVPTGPVEELRGALLRDLGWPALPDGENDPGAALDRAVAEARPREEGRAALALATSCDDSAWLGHAELLLNEHGSALDRLRVKVARGAGREVVADAVRLCALPELSAALGVLVAPSDYERSLQAVFLAQRPEELPARSDIPELDAALRRWGVVLSGSAPPRLVERLVTGLLLPLDQHSLGRVAEVWLARLAGALR